MNILFWNKIFINWNVPSIWEREYLTKLWYLHFPAHTSFAFEKINGRILKVYPVLELLAHMSGFYNYVIWRHTTHSKSVHYCWEQEKWCQVNSRVRPFNFILHHICLKHQLDIHSRLLRQSHIWGRLIQGVSD